ncbi:MAG: imidazoleglycerol-phosphate dehydratase HisB [Candidatus Erginobacter occultus]|nr:imidazoleglycerol-phosphate dehydratase HisB [Candidatus Erginobacter occultus]
MKKRTGRVERKTKETDITIQLNLDGEGKTAIDTGIPFFDHMLELFGRHGLFDLRVKARGDLAVDYHHTVEDLGICLGQALFEALGEKKGICRYGSATLPMDEALASVAVDCGGRSFLVYNPKIRRIKIGDFNVGLFKEFFRAFTDQARIALHINVLYGDDVHHVIEAVFKGLGRALRAATELDPRVKGVPSTKGKL